MMCHMQVMWWIMGLVMWWVRWHVMWWLTHASRAPTRWLSRWLSTKPWWLTAEDAISNCGYAYCSDDSFAYESCHVTGVLIMYKRLCSLLWVPISTSCGFGTQVSLDSDVLDSIMLTCGFGTQSLSPSSVTSALVPSHVETLLLNLFPSSV
jgi:hypothetical protein